MSKYRVILEIDGEVRFDKPVEHYKYEEKIKELQVRAVMIGKPWSLFCHRSSRANSMHDSAIMTEDMVEIKRLYKNGILTKLELAKKFKTKPENIRRILIEMGVENKNLFTQGYSKRSSKYLARIKLTVEKIHEIKRLYHDEKVRVKDLAIMFSINENTASKIVNNKIYNY